MWVVDVFITLDNARVIRVECRIAIRLEVIRRRIFQCRWIGCRIIHLQCLEVSLELYSFFFISQAIKTNILVLPVLGFVAKRIRYLERIRWNLAPYSVVIFRCVVRRRTKAILILTLSITQHIFGNISKVEIQLTTRASRVENIRILQPEFDVFDIAGFKIDLVNITHDATPCLRWIQQPAIRVEPAWSALVIIRSLLSREICKVESCQKTLAEIVRALREDLTLQHLPRLELRKLIEIIS